MPIDHTPIIALRWTPTGKRSKGRPKTTWRIYYIIAELSNMGLTMGEAQVIAQDRKRWKMTLWPYAHIEYRKLCLISHMGMKSK